MEKAMIKNLKTNAYRFLLLTLLITNPATLLPMEQPTGQATAVEIDPTCSLCMSDLPASEFRQLSCGHRFCSACLKDLLRLGLDEEWAQSMATHLHCPQQGCPHQMNEADIQHITGDNARVARYRDILTALFFNANRNIRHCPTAACEAIYEIDFQPENVTCRSCNATYCSYCRQPHERGAECSDVRTAQTAATESTDANIPAEELQERQYQEWLRKNTKPCPKCDVNIQKNEGCNHMTCRMCKHDYCWDCLGAWEINEFHPTYYRCLAAGGQEQAQQRDLCQQPIDQGARIHQYYDNLEASRRRLAALRNNYLNRANNNNALAEALAAFREDRAANPAPAPLPRGIVRQLIAAHLQGNNAEIPNANPAPAPQDPEAIRRRIEMDRIMTFGPML
eukprot:Pompholyxophrys_punicea_v1_NODE_38_length_4733_cov_3.558572.p2 type:complete len:394 gc:universal NODE_38_length_4733_cov_3.558572:2468-1287(-)